MNRTMPNRMRISEMRNCPTSKPKNRAFAQSRMSAPAKPHCSISSGSATRTSASMAAISASLTICPWRVRSMPKRPSSSDAEGADRVVPAARHGANAEVDQPRSGQDRSRQHDLLGDIATERHVADCRARDDGDGEHQEGQLDGQGREPADAIGIEAIEVVHGPQRAGLRDKRPEQEHEQQDGGRDVRDEALRHRHDQRHVDGASELHEHRVDDVDSEDGLDEVQDVGGRPVVDRDEPPLRLARRERDAGEDRARYIDQHTQEHRLGGALPGREEHAETVHSDIEDRRQRPLAPASAPERRPPPR